MPDLSNPLTHKGVTTKLLLGLAALALGQALQASQYRVTNSAMAWLTVALISTGASVASRHLSLPAISPKVLWAVLVTGLIWQIRQLLTSQPGIYMLYEYRLQIWPYQAGVVIGGVCALLSLAPRTWLPPRARSGLVAAAFLAFLATGAWMIHASPHPIIDTYMFQQTSSEALLQGHDPYELTLPNIYRDTNFYAAEWVKDGKMTVGNPYPPLSIYLSLLGYAVAGDIRYSSLLAILVAAALMACLRPSREALLAAYIFLFTPRGSFVIEQSWTEPLVLLLSVVVVWCAIHRPSLKSVALGLLVASKQYMIFLLPLIILLFPRTSPRRIWIKAGGWAAGVAFVVTAPLAFANFPAFLWNVGLAQWYQIFRYDSLSYAALYARATGQLPSQLLPFVVLCVALLLTWRYAAHSPAGFAAALALCLGLFFAFSKQAFFNYYFLVIGLLCSAFAAEPMLDNLFATGRKSNIREHLEADAQA